MGRLYRRRDLHHQYGGQRQGGISTPSAYPLVFLFTGETGEQYGYRDGWESDGTFRYTGEGQIGDMAFVRGNAAIRDHAAEGKDLHLFTVTSKGFVRYQAQMICAGYELVPGIPDRSGNLRTAIVFQLVQSSFVEDSGGFTKGDAPSTANTEPALTLWVQPLDDLRGLALQSPPAGLTAKETRRNAYHRSEAVRVYVLRRAGGICEGCGQLAPFVTKAGRPYLEPHHTRRLSDGGPDHPAWVIAVCPNCHRRAHHAEDAAEFNGGLMATANSLDAEVHD